MTISEKIEQMSDEQLKSIWKSLGTQSWCGSDMYDENTTMDEWGMMIMAEMDSRGLNKFE
jgi:hypothetical protein